jgi:hypothetical protein
MRCKKKYTCHHYAKLLFTYFSFRKKDDFKSDIPASIPDAHSANLMNFLTEPAGISSGKKRLISGIAIHLGLGRTQQGYHQADRDYHGHSLRPGFKSSPTQRQSHQPHQ